MAAYNELFGLIRNSELRNKVAVAVGVAADVIRQELDTVPNHANRLLWAKQAFERPMNVAEDILWSVIIANKDQDVATILAASDTAIQSNVDAVIDLFATG